MLESCINCPICLEVITDINYTTVKCNHTFHSLCINEWFNNNNNCPLCRIVLKIDSDNNINNDAFDDFSMLPDLIEINNPVRQEINDFWREEINRINSNSIFQYDSSIPIFPPPLRQLIIGDRDFSILPPSIISSDNDENNNFSIEINNFEQEQSSTQSYSIFTLLEQSVCEDNVLSLLHDLVEEVLTSIN
jgi:hypothetical protein